MKKAFGEEGLERLLRLRTAEQEKSYRARTDAKPSLKAQLESLARIRDSRGLEFRIEIDGGVALDTVGNIVRAGAEILVAGNAVFAKGDIRENARKLLETARAAVTAKGRKRRLVRV